MKIKRFKTPKSTTVLATPTAINFPTCQKTGIYFESKNKTANPKSASNGVITAKKSGENTITGTGIIALSKTISMPKFLKVMNKNQATISPRRRIATMSDFLNFVIVFIIARMANFVIQLYKEVGPITQYILSARSDLYKL